PLAASAVASRNWYLVMVSLSASLSENSEEAAKTWPWVADRSAAVTTGAGSTGALTWNSFQPLQVKLSKARIHKSSEPEPAPNVVRAGCPAAASIAISAPSLPDALPICPLAASAVESQNWYLVMVSLSASLTENSEEAARTWPWVADWSAAVTTG